MTASNHGENSNVLQPHMHMQCMKVVQRNGLSEAREGMHNCMKCLGRRYPGLLVHWLGIGSTPSVDAHLLFHYHQDFTGQLCFLECPDLAPIKKSRLLQGLSSGC